MNINTNSHLWRFVAQYASSQFVWEFESGRGNVCKLMRGIIFAVLKCIFVTILAFGVFQMLIGPWFSLITTGHFFVEGPGWIPLTALVGVASQGATLVLGCIGLVAYCYQEWRRNKKPTEPKKPSIIGEYIAGVKGKYCTRVTLVNANGNK